MKSLIELVGVISLICLTDAYISNPAVSLPPLVCPCDYKYNPVCGSDGVTYMNKCVLDCTSCYNVDRGLPPINMITDCECSGNCNCQNVDLPVCTLDGATYPNECVLACENKRRIEKKQPILYLAYRTACRGVSGDCSDIAAPVCGTDNVLYRNRCVLDYVNSCNVKEGLPAISVKNNGACQNGFLCPITRQPVCATDGNVYENPCELESENERRRCSEVAVFITEADPSVCKQCRCPKQKQLVCASDWNTYANPCQVDCENRKRKDPKLRILYKGACIKCECKDEYRPVCGTDRKTYDNSCLLECENIGRNEDLPPLKVFHVGECQIFTCDCSYCDDNYQPMCGSDGNTYWNLCWLQCNDRCCQKNGQSAVFLARRGPC